MPYLDTYFSKVESAKRCKASVAYLAALDVIEQKYPLIAKQIVQELQDQRSHLKLIASENYSSLAVQLAMGNLLTDKYCEGIPGHRFYAGCEQVDVIENAAAEELKTLFGADHAYVQPHSGADANLVAFWAILTQRVQNKELEKMGKKGLEALSPAEFEGLRKMLVGQKMMGLSLSSGGHLTHGFRQNISAKMMESIPYDVDPKTGLIDYDVLQQQVKKEKPLILVAGYSAYPRKINFAKMRQIADSVGAVLMVDMAHFAGLVAGKVMQGEYDPIPFAHVVTSTTHKTLRGPRGGVVLCCEEFKEAVDRGCPLVMGGPLPHVIAAKAIAFKEANTKEFQQYAHQIVANAQALAEAFQKRGIPVMTGGTDNHLLIIDIASHVGLTGRQAEMALREAYFTVNRNLVPFDAKGPWHTSGIRIGTPAITTLGMKEQEMEEIADCMVLVLKTTKSLPSDKPGEKFPSKVKTDPEVIQEIQRRKNDLLARFPLYPELVID